MLRLVLLAGLGIMNRGAIEVLLGVLPLVVLIGVGRAIVLLPAVRAALQFPPPQPSLPDTPVFLIN